MSSPAPQNRKFVSQPTPKPPKPFRNVTKELFLVPVCVCVCLTLKVPLGIPAADFRTNDICCHMHTNSPNHQQPPHLETHKSTANTHTHTHRLECNRCPRPRRVVLPPRRSSRGHRGANATRSRTSGYHLLGLKPTTSVPPSLRRDFSSRNPLFRTLPQRSCCGSFCLSIL